MKKEILNMSKMRLHPKYHKNCVFCTNWMGNTELKFISSMVGYEFEASAKGKCLRGSEHPASYGCTRYFEPNDQAKKLM